MFINMFRPFHRAVAIGLITINNISQIIDFSI